MAETMFDERRSTAMDDAFPEEARSAGALVPAGPTIREIHQLPRGAVKVEVARDLAKVRRNIKTLAQIASKDFYYRWPVETKVTDKRTGQETIQTTWIEGPSVKLANAVAREYGNCFAGVTDVETTETHWIIEAQFIDFETGYVYRRFFQQRKGQNISKKMDKGRAEDIVFQIAQSKAIRNVVTNALSDFADYALEVAKESIIERIAKNMEAFRQRILAWLNEHGVEKERVERMSGRTFDKWLVPDLGRISAEIQAINDGMATPDEMWPVAAVTENVPQERPEHRDYRDGNEPFQGYQIAPMKDGGGFFVVKPDGRQLVSDGGGTPRKFESAESARAWIKDQVAGADQPATQEKAPARTRVRSPAKPETIKLDDGYVIAPMPDGKGFSLALPNGELIQESETDKSAARFDTVADAMHWIDDDRKETARIAAETGLRNDVGGGSNNGGGQGEALGEMTQQASTAEHTTAPSSIEQHTEAVPQAESIGHHDGVIMLESAAESIRNGEIDHTVKAVEEFRDLMKANINSIPKERITDQERADLHTRWATIIVNALAEAEKKQKSRRGR